MLGVSGLAKGLPFLRLEWPERSLREVDLAALDYHWHEANPVDLPLDHISYHSDGFHLKTVKAAERYVHRVSSEVPLTPDTPTFLRFILFSDAARYYADTTTKPNKPHVSIGIPENHVLSAEGAFSGARYPLLTYVNLRLHAWGSGPTVVPAVLMSGGLQGMVWWRTDQPPEEWLSGRPRGTLISFKFPQPDGCAQIKTLLVG